MCAVQTTQHYHTSFIFILKVKVRPTSQSSRFQRHPNEESCVRSIHWFWPFNTSTSPPNGPLVNTGLPTTVKLKDVVWRMLPSIWINVSLCTLMSLTAEERKKSTKTDITALFELLMQYYMSGIKIMAIITNLLNVVRKIKQPEN